MRTSRIPYVLFFLLLMFAWNGLLWGMEGREVGYNTPHGWLTIEFDAKNKITSAKIGTIAIPVRDVGTLKFIASGDTTDYVIYDVPAGTVITTGPGNTCFWYFNGNQYLQYCW